MMGMLIGSVLIRMVMMMRMIMVIMLVHSDSDNDNGMAIMANLLLILRMVTKRRRW